MHNPSIPRHRIQIPLKIRPAHKINNDIDALSIRGGKDLLGPILRIVIEARRGAEFAEAEIDFGFRSGGDEDLGGAVTGAELDAGDGDGGGAGVPEDGLAWMEAANEVEGLGCCYPGLPRSYQHRFTITSYKRCLLRMKYLSDERRKVKGIDI